MASAVGRTSSASSIQSSVGGSGGRISNTSSSAIAPPGTLRSASDSALDGQCRGAEPDENKRRKQARGRRQRLETRRYTPLMEPDDEDALEPYRSPDDRERIWLHPSELGSLLPPVGDPERSRRRRRRPWRRLRAL